MQPISGYLMSLDEKIIRIKKINCLPAYCNIFDFPIYKIQRRYENKYIAAFEKQKLTEKCT